MFFEFLPSLNTANLEFFGYGLVFLIVFLESLPLIGVFIPGGGIVLIIGGILSRVGDFNIFYLIAVGIFASVVTDTFGYFLGRFIDKERFTKEKSFLLVKRETIFKIKKFVHGHTGKALIFGRFNPLTRAVAPFVVGIEKVDFLKFFTFNVIGGVLWVCLFSFSGYVIGGNLKNLNSIDTLITIVTIVLITGFYLYYRFEKRRNKGKTLLEINGVNS